METLFPSPGAPLLGLSLPTGPSVPIGWSSARQMIVLDSSAAMSEYQTWEWVWLPSPVISAEQRRRPPCSVLCLAQGHGQQSWSSRSSAPIGFGAAHTDSCHSGTPPLDPVWAPGAYGRARGSGSVWEGPHEVSASSIVGGGERLLEKWGWEMGSEAHGGTGWGHCRYEGLREAC